MLTLADPSIAPAPGLVTPANSASGQQSQFGLFTSSWIELQSYVGAALDLPMSKGNFEEKYGTFDSSKTITDCIGAMQSVKNAAAEFGNPKTLRQQLIVNPNLLATPTPPAEIYTHTVWLGQRVHETAGRIVSGYESVLEELPGMPGKDQVEAIKAYLFDETLGPIPLSKKMSDEAGVLIKKLGVFEAKMNEYNAKLKAFTGSSSQMMADVNTAIGSLQQRIKSLEASRDAAYKAWQDFTIAACTTSVGCFLIGAILAPATGGVSLVVGTVAAIATGVGLGIKAAQCRAEYNLYCDQIASERADLVKKQRLRSDLGDFDKKIQLVAPAMQGFLKNLQAVQGAWVQMNTDMLAINASLNPGNVGTMPFLVKAKAKMAIDAWKSVDDSAKQFTVQSLVDYQGIAFGQKMPEKLAA